jgi:hypothetical protein
MDIYVMPTSIISYETNLKLRQRIHQLGLLQLQSDMLQTPQALKRGVRAASPQVAEVMTAVKGKPVEKMITKLKDNVAAKKLQAAPKKESTTVSQFKVKDKVSQLDKGKVALPPRIPKPRMMLKEKHLLKPVAKLAGGIASASGSMTPSRSAAVRAQKVTKTTKAPVKEDLIATAVEEVKKEAVELEQKIAKETVEEPLARSSPRRNPGSAVKKEEYSLGENVQPLGTPKSATPSKAESGSAKKGAALTPSPARPVIGKRKRLVLNEMNDASTVNKASPMLKQILVKKIKANEEFEEETGDDEDQEPRNHDGWLSRVWKGVTTSLFLM